MNPDQANEFSYDRTVIRSETQYTTLFKKIGLRLVETLSLNEDIINHVELRDYDGTNGPEIQIKHQRSRHFDDPIINNVRYRVYVLKKVSVTQLANESNQYHFARKEFSTSPMPVTADLFDQVAVTSNTGLNNACC